MTKPSNVTVPSIDAVVSCLSDYDPNALHVDRAREAMRACLIPLTQTERVPLRAALGRVLAEQIVPTINVPSHANSAMDGYAVRAADLNAQQPVSLTEVGGAFAGRAFDGTLGQGECVRIMTGAVMPQGSDTVVIQEMTRQEHGRIVIPAAQRAGQNVRLAGEDLRIGVPVLQPGRRLQAADIGLIASLGIGEVQVIRRLRVAFFSTGDELASIGTPLQPGEVYDSNRYTLQAMLETLGVEWIDLGVVRDDPTALEAAFLQAAQQADAIVTSGGVSVGEADFTKATMAKLGEVLFWKIAMRPGRPMAFGRIQTAEHQAALFGLPGNPVAVMVTFYQFVRQALLHLSGCKDAVEPGTTQAISTQAIRKVAGRTEYQRGIAQWHDARLEVRLTGQQGSGVLRSMSEANCFIVLEHTRGDVTAGELVTIQLFDGLMS